MSDDLIPDFELASTGNKQFRLSDVKSRYLVIFFYPKDDTPGCTSESQQFRDLYPEFVQIGCEIVGISRDNLKSHDKFRGKYDLPYDLLSDSDEVVCELFGVMKMKNMYGKQVRGIERSTFVLIGMAKCIRHGEVSRFQGMQRKFWRLSNQSQPENG